MIPQVARKNPTDALCGDVIACGTVSYEKKELSSPGQNIRRASP